MEHISDESRQYTVISFLSRLLPSLQFILEDPKVCQGYKGLWSITQFSWILFRMDKTMAMRIRDAASQFAVHEAAELQGTYDHAEICTPQC